MIKSIKNNNFYYKYKKIVKILKNHLLSTNKEAVRRIKIKKTKIKQKILILELNIATNLNNSKMFHR
jgi:hypothetical protein